MPTANRSHFLVDPSHAPLLASIALFCASESLIILLNSVSTLLILVPLVLNMWFLSAEIGFIDNASIVSESTRSRYMISFYWLVAAEAFAFFSLLFSWFTNSIWAPAVSVSSIITSAEMPSAIGLSLINSALLLSSSVTITYSHISLSFSSLQITVNGLVITIVLSVVFLSVQWVEFSISSLTIASSFYSSILFSSLSFHSMHVLVSVLFLIYALGRVLSSNATPESHPVYLCSVIYWHFVDVVWVFVYFSYYLAL